MSTDTGATSEARSDARFDPGLAARILLASLSAGAGAVHLALVPSHAGSSVAEGIGFAAAGWAQLLLAAVVVARPGKRLLQASIALNLVLIAAWALSRTSGLPFGAHAGHPETVGGIDLLTVAFEAVGSIAAAVVMARPAVWQRLSAASVAAGAIVPAVALVAATAAIASPSARDHAASAHGDHNTELASGSDGSPIGHADRHAHDDAPLNGDGHGHAGDHAEPVAAEGRCDWKFNTTEFWKRNPPASDEGGHEHEHGTGNGQGNEHGIQPWKPMTDPAKCSQLEAEIAQLEKVAMRYPTARDAMAAGCFRITIYVPGIAAHYFCVPNARSGIADIEKPTMILYAGSQPWAPVVGLSFLAGSAGNPALDPDAPLWVRYSTWHYHEGLCLAGGQVVGGDNSDEAKCAAAGGRKIGRTGYMGHYWLPTCNSPDGVFSAANPRLDMAVANFNDDPANDPTNGGAIDLVKNPCSKSELGSGLDDVFGPPD